MSLRWSFIFTIIILFLLNVLTQNLWAKDRTSYLLGKDDVIRVFVWDHPELSGDMVVNPAGNISFLLLGDVMVEGLTEEELEKILTEKFSQYIMSPQVSVTIVGYNSKKIYILGEVSKPGEYPIGGTVISLREAILKAGLPTKSAALGRVRIITPQPTKPIVKIVNLSLILNKGCLKEDIELQAGDIVYIPSNIPAKIGDGLDKIASPISRILAFIGLIEGIKGIGE
ncbi:MAG: polysaccharide biosynthesis/export family protein [bacterium]